MAKLPFCLCGVRGGDLKQRIESIMAGRRRTELTRARRAALFCAALGFIAAPVVVGALTMRPQASIKRNVSVGQLSSMNGEPGGRMVVTNHTLLNIIRQVYRLQRYQVVGGADWVDKEHWDILAKAADDAPFDQLRRMMQTLLADRFKLLAHRETREMPVYALVLPRPDSKSVDGRLRSDRGGREVGRRRSAGPWRRPAMRDQHQQQPAEDVGAADDRPGEEPVNHDGQVCCGQNRVGRDLRS
jgi:hypothetical protein